MLLADKNRSGDITIRQFSVDMLENHIVDSTGQDITVLFVDVETTGLSYENDKVIQLALRPVSIDKNSGKITRLVNTKVFYNDYEFKSRKPTLIKKI